MPGSRRRVFDPTVFLRAKVLGHSLFRQEAIEFQRGQREFGDIALLQPVSTKAAGLAADRRGDDRDRLSLLSRSSRASKRSPDS